MAPLDADIILDFFQSNDLTANIDNPVIDETRLKALIQKLDSSMNPNATKFVLRDLNIKIGMFPPLLFDATSPYTSNA